jgi:probable HAF family extracellular repeat protein
MSTLPGLPFGTATLQDAATDINTAGIIVGQVGANFFPGNVNAVAWVPSDYATYPSALSLGDLAFGSKNSYAAAINDLGVVVGASEHANAGGYHAFRSEAESGNPLALTPNADMGNATANDADPSEARDINDIGELVGASKALNGQYRAMYKTAGMIWACFSSRAPATGAGPMASTTLVSSWASPPHGCRVMGELDACRWSHERSLCPIKAMPAPNRCSI